MAKKLKRAFTIVELVIVIAVIAILAAVLIPTFTTLIDRANQSADTSNVKNMNSILSMDETTNGKPKTMHDAVKVIREGGYDLEKLTPTGQGYDIVWDQDANRLLMVNGNEVIFGETEKNANEKHLWVVVDSEEKIAATGYSVYLTDAVSGAVEAKQGVDVGSNKDITTVTYNPTEKQDVTIRTKGGALVVNAAAATVSHHGAAASVDIQAVAKESYHEYGTVNQIDVTAGRVVLESGAATKTVYVKGEGVKVEWKEDAKPEGVGVSADVNINNVDIQNDADVTVSTGIDKDEASEFAGGLGIESSPYQIATAEQFMKINGKADKYYVLLNNIDLREQETTSQNTGYSAWFGYIASLSGGQIDGAGNVIRLAPKTSLCNEIRNATIKNVEITNTGYEEKEYNDAPLVSYNTYGNVYFDKITTSGCVALSGNCSAFIVYMNDNITMTDCVNKATLVGTNGAYDYNGVFVGYLVGTKTIPKTFNLTFENCVNEGSIVCGKASAFLGNNPNGLFTANITVNNFTNTGMIRSTYTDESFTPNMFFASAAGTMNVLYNGNTYDKTEVSNVFCPGLVQDKADIMTAEFSEDGVLTFTKSTYDTEKGEVAYYLVTYGAYVGMIQEDGNTGSDRYYISEKIIANGSASYTATMKKYKLTEDKTMASVGEFNSANGKNIQIVKDSEGELYYLLNEEMFFLGDQNSNNDTQSFTLCTIEAYDSNGEFISSISIA